MSTIQLEEIPEKEIVPGFFGRFIHSPNMTIAHWRIEAGAVMPAHSHPHEQVVNPIEGTFELMLDGEKLKLESGKALIIPSSVEHSGRALTDCRVIEVFHPVREDYR